MSWRIKKWKSNFFSFCWQVSKLPFQSQQYIKWLWCCNTFSLIWINSSSTITNLFIHLTNWLVHIGVVWIIDSAMVAEWSKTLVRIQVAISPLQTQVQFLLRACIYIVKYMQYMIGNAYALPSWNWFILLSECCMATSFFWRMNWELLFLFKFLSRSGEL